MLWGRRNTEGPDDAALKRALSAVSLPQGGTLADSDRLAGFSFDKGTATLTIEIDPAAAAEFEPVRRAAEAALKSLPGVDKALVVLTAHQAAEAARPKAPRAEIHQHKAGQKPAPAPAPSGQGLAGIAAVKKLVAVASGKGGVGKSTVAVNLAVALARKGLKIGLLDADIYGPSVPRLMGTTEKPEPSGAEGRLAPVEAHGLKLMSMGFLVDEAAPMIWRGPMVQSALIQMLRDVDWGALDMLIIDMPPGTGDAQLTLAQQTPLAGAVIVSTPQDIALIDARKAIAMFEKVRVPILGIVENMSYFLCPHCGERSEIFGTGGARQEAQARGVPFLGEVPLHGEIRVRSDAGSPVACDDGPNGEAFAHVAEAVLRRFEADARKAPRLVVD